MSQKMWATSDNTKNWSSVAHWPLMTFLIQFGENITKTNTRSTENLAKT